MWQIAGGVFLGLLGLALLPYVTMGAIYLYFHAKMVTLATVGGFIRAGIIWYRDGIGAGFEFMVIYSIVFLPVVYVAERWWQDRKESPTVPDAKR